MSNFKQWLETQQLSLEAWGDFITKEVCQHVQEKIGPDRFKGFFKIPANFRTKDISSALKKQEKKQYSDPKTAMTDLVGARFVVLLRTDIAIVEQVITTHWAWTIRRDRNPLDERDAAPSSFDYQSVHYILRNTEDRIINGVSVPAETACEVQIRTVLQHAYAELGHDRIYKGETTIPASVRRLVARSMALMETTDEMFCAAVDQLACVNISREAWAKILDDCYRDASISFSPTLQDKEALEIIDTFSEYLKKADSSEIKNIASGAILKRIKNRIKVDNLFCKPTVLLVYWLVQNLNNETRRMWPIPKFSNELDQIFSDLGFS